MNRFRHIFFALWMALAVVVGQQAVVLHDLAHAAGHKQESTPGKSTCDKCFACAELSGAVGTSIPSVVLPDTAPRVRHVHSDAPVFGAPRLAFRSRAPPTLL
ncbi:MAG: hypothetical protein H7Y14_09635 [Burkholderiales bacterium]|nr:hypothetical protein [Burkholderiales bacterium]